VAKIKSSYKIIFPLTPKSKFKEALGCFCSLIPYMKNYTLDNNVAERAVRALAIGRKNWLFFGSGKSGQSAGVLLSLLFKLAEV